MMYIYRFTSWPTGLRGAEDLDLVLIIRSRWLRCVQVIRDIYSPILRIQRVVGRQWHWGQISKWWLIDHSVTGLPHCLWNCNQDEAALTTWTQARQRDHLHIGIGLRLLPWSHCGHCRGGQSEGQSWACQSSWRCSILGVLGKWLCAVNLMYALTYHIMRSMREPFTVYLQTLRGIHKHPQHQFDS